MNDIEWALCRLFINCYLMTLILITWLVLNEIENYYNVLPITKEISLLTKFITSIRKSIKIIKLQITYSKSFLRKLLSS